MGTCMARCWPSYPDHRYIPVRSRYLRNEETVQDEPRRLASITSSTSSLLSSSDVSLCMEEVEIFSSVTDLTNVVDDDTLLDGAQPVEDTKILLVEHKSQLVDVDDCLPIHSSSSKDARSTQPVGLTNSDLLHSPDQIAWLPASKANCQDTVPPRMLKTTLPSLLNPAEFAGSTSASAPNTSAPTLSTSTPALNISTSISESHSTTTHRASLPAFYEYYNIALQADDEIVLATNHERQEEEEEKEEETEDDEAYGESPLPIRRTNSRYVTIGVTGKRWGIRGTPGSSLPSLTEPDSPPTTSIDLEWEPEAGLVRMSRESLGEEEASQTAESGSWIARSSCSTPNSLEWDFKESTLSLRCGTEDEPWQHTDMETEQLLHEIEQLAARALADTGHGLQPAPR